MAATWKFWAGSQGGFTWDLDKNHPQEHSTQVLHTSMFLQLKAAGLEPWPALRDWLVILASVPKSLTLVLQSKTSRKREPAAVHGGNVKVLGWFQDGLYVELIAKSFSWNEFLTWRQNVRLWNWGCTGDLDTNHPQEHSTQVLRTSMFLQLKAVRTWAMTCFKGLAKYFGFRAKIRSASFA